MPVGMPPSGLNTVTVRVRAKRRIAVVPVVVAAHHKGTATGIFPIGCDGGAPGQRTVQFEPVEQDVLLKGQSRSFRHAGDDVPKSLGIQAKQGHGGLLSAVRGSDPSFPGNGR